MHEDLQALYKVQEADSEIMLVQRALHGLDKGHAELAALQEATEKHTEAHKALQQATRDLADSELEQKTVETKKKLCEDKLYGGRVTAFKELEALQQEIAALDKRRGDLDVRILTLMDDIERLKPLDTAARAVKTKARLAHEAKVAAHAKRTGLLNAKLEELYRRRAERLPAVSAELLRRYDSIRSHAHGVAVGRIDAGRCGACHTNLPAQTIHCVKHDMGLRTCDNCGRMLCWGSD
ncbi:MAG: C4-type zinc ribbon domain-containing protein [Armatimonadetes bacterium]|nr:C4-type zinc ribbon domain-containing protein [Armatimonadota bacterium]